MAPPPGAIFCGTAEPHPCILGRILGPEAVPGEGFINETYIRMGFHPAFMFRHVVELTLNEDQVVAEVDRSREMEEVRKKMERSDWNGTRSLPEWIESCIKIEYS